MNNFFQKCYIMLLLCLVNSAIAKGQVVLSNMVQVHNVIDDVVFRSLLEVDMKKAEEIHLSTKKCFIPMLNFIEKNIFKKGSTVSLDVDKMKRFIVTQIKAGATKKELSKKLLVSLQKEEFKATELSPAKLSDEK